MQSITNVGKNGGYGRRMVKNGSRALMKMRSKDQINMMAAAAAKAQEQEEPPEPVPIDQKEDETERLKKLSSYVDLLMVP